MERPLFVAEISANHLGRFDRAEELVRAAASAGATHVKLQTYTADTMTLPLRTKEFSVSEDHELWGGKSLHDLYLEAHTPWEWHKPLFELARELGMIPFSSPFDNTAVDFLESLDIEIYKIASLESSDLQLIHEVSSTGKPTIISTGATELYELDAAVSCFLSTGNKMLTLLVCTSSYPAQATDANLDRLSFLKNRYGLAVGVSDHTLGIGVSIAAIAKGASIIEKHLTLSRAEGGLDSAFSLEPAEFSKLVNEGINAWESIGLPDWKLAPSEKESRRLRRSLYIVRNVRKGETISLDNIRSIRPGNGLSPLKLNEILGKTFTEDLETGTPMKMEYCK